MAMMLVTLGLEASNVVQQHYTDEYNQKLLERQQVIDSEKTKLQTEELDRQNRYQLGEAKVAYAGSGVSISTGSPMDELAFQVSQGTFKKKVVEFNGLLQQQDDQSKEAVNKYLSRQHLEEGLANMASTFGNIYGRYHGPGLGDNGDGGMGSGVGATGGGNDLMGLEDNSSSSTGLFDTNGSGIVIAGDG